MTITTTTTNTEKRKLTWVNLPRRRDIKPPKKAEQEGSSSDEEDATAVAKNKTDMMIVHLLISQPCYVFPKKEGQPAAPYYLTKLKEDFEVSVLVHAKLKDCFDQGGLMVRTKVGGPYVTCGLRHYYNYACESVIGACSHIVADIDSADNELDIPREDLPRSDKRNKQELWYYTQEGEDVNKPSWMVYPATTTESSRKIRKEKNSAWSVEDLEKAKDQYVYCWFKVSRVGPLIQTWYSKDGNEYMKLASKFFAPDHDSLQVGLYGASPSDSRCRMKFEDFSV